MVVLMEPISWHYEWKWVNAHSLAVPGINISFNVLTDVENYYHQCAYLFFSNKKNYFSAFFKYHRINLV